MTNRRSRSITSRSLDIAPCLLVPARGTGHRLWISRVGYTLARDVGRLSDWPSSFATTGGVAVLSWPTTRGAAPSQIQPAKAAMAIAAQGWSSRLWEFQMKSKILKNEYSGLC
jgi:hypothetical protein